MKITEELVTTLGELARIELRPEEKTMLVGQLPAIVDYVGTLKSVAVDAPPPSRENPPLPRADEVHSATHREAILGQAPDRLEDFWRVPPVL